MQTLTFRNGWQCDVHPLTEGVSESEAPYRLVRTNGRGKHAGKTFRPIRNHLRPNQCFLVAEINPFSSMGSLDLWVTIQPDGTLKASG